MSPVAPRRQNSLSVFNGPIAIVAAVAVVVLLVGLPMAFGLIDLSKFRDNKPSTAGLVAIPTAAKVIPAYTRVRRDHLWDAANTRLSIVYLPPRAVTPEMITSIADVIGRVLDHDKEPGYVFTESDFLPKGTREGIVAGIPAGMRAVRVSADKVEGMYGLHAGDRVDLLATLPIDAGGAGGAQPFNAAGVYGPQLALQAQLSNWTKQATVRVIVQNAILVEPMMTRGVATVQSSLTEGAQTRVRAVQEAVIAIRPDEVALLTEAMAVDARLTTVPRSGRPDDPGNSRTPDLQPFSPFSSAGEGEYAADASAGADPNGGNFRVVETIMGQKHALTAVPRR
jgi:Flp pilus assembly protein CpaB